MASHGVCTSVGGHVRAVRVGSVVPTGLEKHRIHVSGGSEAQGRKNTACRHGCRFSESLAGVRQTVVAMSNPR
jgi:hypothetical protein